MKFLLISLSIFTAVNCGNGAQKKQENNKTDQVETSQDLPLQNGILVGRITEENLRAEPFSSWFKPLFESYLPTPESLEVIKEHIGDYDIKVFMGTWCSDSRREVPKLLKILELSDYDMDDIEIFGVTRNKTLPNGLHEQYQISYVPTIIFYKDGEEVNRFVEYPRETIEEDIAAIVSGEAYKNSHEQ